MLLEGAKQRRLVRKKQELRERFRKRQKKNPPGKTPTGKGGFDDTIFSIMKLKMKRDERNEARREKEAKRAAKSAEPSDAEKLANLAKNFRTTVESLGCDPGARLMVAHRCRAFLQFLKPP